MNADEHRLPGETSPEDFEARLSSQPFRTAPVELRRQVLMAARMATAKPANEDRGTARRFGWFDWLFLRCPLATGGLAACWLVIWLGGSVDRWANGTVAAKPVIVSREQIAEARAQRAELLQLAGFDDPTGKVQSPSADRPRLEAPAAPTRPRSDRRRPRDDGFGVLPEANFQQVAAVVSPPPDLLPVLA